ncbi:MAG: OmpH family outer membrane protein [Candidatus Omnitrophota bacterium]
MKKGITVFVGGLFVLAMLAGSASAADKLGYIDLSRTFNEYYKTKDYDKVLGDKQAAYDAERTKKVSEVKQLQEKINLLSDKEKETKKSDIEAKVKSLQEFDRQKQTDLRKEQDEKMKEILKDIESAVKQYAEKEGYTFIFNDRVLVYQTKSLEITNKIIEVINKGNTVKK